MQKKPLSQPGTWPQEHTPFFFFFQKKSPLQPHSRFHLPRSRRGIRNIYCAVLKVWVIHDPEGLWQGQSHSRSEFFLQLKAKQAGWPQPIPSRIPCPGVTCKQTSRKRRTHSPWANNKFQLSFSLNPFLERNQFPNSAKAWPCYT